MNKLSENIDIGTRLNNIFKNRFNIDLFDSKYNQNINENLLGSEFRLKARHLIYLLFDIEKEFNVIIPEEAIDNEQFNTINNIIDIIIREIDKKDMEAV